MNPEDAAPLPAEARQQMENHPRRPLPPMPWRLRAPGPVLITLHAVEVECVEPFVPPELRIVQILPGKTIGGFFCARYGPGSDLQYNELIVGAATVWHRKRPCLWVTHLFVDDERSLDGGRALLGAPKHLATFTRSSESPNAVSISAADGAICRITHGRQVPLWRHRLRLVALHRDVRSGAASTGSVSVHGNEIRGRWGITRARVQIPTGSPLADLGLERPLLGVLGHEVELLLGGAPFLPLHRMTAPTSTTDQPDSTAR